MCNNESCGVRDWLNVFTRNFPAFLSGFKEKERRLRVNGVLRLVTLVITLGEPSNRKRFEGSYVITKERNGEKFPNDV